MGWGRELVCCWCCPSPTQSTAVDTLLTHFAHKKIPSYYSWKQEIAEKCVILPMHVNGCFQNGLCVASSLSHSLITRRQCYKTQWEGEVRKRRNEKTGEGHQEERDRTWWTQSSPVRYPCFLIEWIFHWIEYSQFLLFE